MDTARNSSTSRQQRLGPRRRTGPAQLQQAHNQLHGACGFIAALLPLAGPGRPAPFLPRTSARATSSDSGKPSSPQGPPKGYDPSLAAGFQPPKGEEPFWWVEKFEARRQAEAAAAAAQAALTAAADNATDASSSSSSSARAGPVQPSALPTPETTPGSSAPAQQQGNAAATTPGQQRLNPRLLLLIAGQVLQLCVATAALILWPAAASPGGLHVPRVWGLWLLYVAFFCSGSVARIVRHGPLSPRSKDAQARSWGSKAAQVLFIAAMPLVHWSVVTRYCQLLQRMPQVAGWFTGYDLLAMVLLPAALALHWSAAQHLGRAYDRVVVPEQLVTTGPYALVQHPIYTSYMLLFTGFCMALHSAGAALTVTGVCLLYYGLRCRLEQGVLREAFGKAYVAYAAETGWFAPKLSHVLLRGMRLRGISNKASSSGSSSSSSSLGS